MLGIIAVFIDTFVVLNITIFIVMSSGILDTNFDANNKPIKEGIVLVQEAFKTGFMGEYGYIFIAVCLLFFAFSTIIGWYYFGETNIRYLFGARGLLPYQLIVVLCIFAGSLLKINLVWQMSDFFNSIMVIPNLIALLLLSGKVAQLLKEYNEGKPFDRNRLL